MPEAPNPDSSLAPAKRGPQVLAAAQLTAIIDSAHDGIVAKTLDGTVTAWNSAAERIFGYSAAEMIGASIFRLVPPELHAEEQATLDRIGRGERVDRYETTRLRKDGTPVAVELTVSPIRDADGVIVGASCIKRDVTGRRRTTEALARLAAIVESTDDPILSKTLAGIITSWNPAAEQVFGYTAAEVVGRSINCIVPEALQGEETEILSRVARGEHVAHYETLRRRKDGTELNISLTISPLRDLNGKVVGASSIMRDITERLRTEATLRQTAKLEAIGRLAGGLAHDFNNQLYALSGFTHFVGRDPGLSAASRHDLLQVQQAIERMAGMTRQLLAFARQQVLNPETLDLNDVVTDTQPLLQRLIGSNIAIELALAAGPKWVRVDRSQLVQVLMNLVINARDAMEESGTVAIQTQTLEVSPGERLDRVGAPIEAGAFAELAVSDSGAGIAPEHLPRIFEPFFTTKEAGHGTGLGLATVDGIVSQSGGHIQVESAPDRGTTVRVLFPLAKEPARSAPPAGRPRGRGSSGRILVVDDEPQVRAILARTLRADGHDVIEAVDGRSAIACFEEVGGAIDLLLTDVVMPGISGRDLVRELTRRSPALPVVWVSGHPRDVGMRDFSPEHPFLQKPVEPDLLVDTIRQVLERQARSPR